MTQCKQLSVNINARNKVDDIVIVIGCNGLADVDNFVYCNSVINSIVDLSEGPKESRERAVTFLDNACGLFDAPCFDYNKCVNIVNFLYRQFGIIDEDGLHKIQSFIRMHKTCGIYIMLLLKEDFNEQNKDTNQQ